MKLKQNLSDKKSQVLTFYLLYYSVVNTNKNSLTVILSMPQI